MSSRHDDLIEYYSDPNNCFFIPEDIEQICTETSFNDCQLLESISPKSPDLIYFLDDSEKVYVAEVKSSFTQKSQGKGFNQLAQYSKILKRQFEEVRAVLILGDYIFMEGESI